MSTSTHAVTLENFDDTIENQQIVVLNFWAKWCGPCKTLSPIFEELAHHHPDIFFGKVDIEEAKDLAEAFQVRSVPTLMAFKQGELVFEKGGLPNPDQLLQLLENLRTMTPTPLEELPPEEEP